MSKSRLMRDITGVMGKKIKVCLTFNGQAKDAAEFYTSIFKNSSIQNSNQMCTSFTLEGEEYMALNGPPSEKNSYAMSLFVTCANQEEVDHYWDNLVKEGEELNCGWLRDKFGITWQIVPVQLGEMLGNKDKAKADYAMQEMMKMKKIVIAKLQNNK
eukprot:NODE_948_length_2832_cov_0.151482.p3 type:complete len:157 gc:universal NODE_948_length_2832_cov_0.151482:2355-1885(-)